MLRSYPFRTEYRSSRGSIAEEFLVPALERAASYVRAAGYFRSSVYWTLESGLRPFIKRGGRIRIICSAELTAQDVRAIDAAYVSREEAAGQALLRELDRLMTLDVAQRHLAVYATLVRFGVVDIKVALHSKGKGIFHEKLGAFADKEGEAVSFTGSSNESWMGWHPEGNLESIEVFSSWQGEREAERVRNHLTYLESLWRGNESGVDVFNLPEAVQNRLLTFARDDLEGSFRLARPHQKTSPRQASIDPMPHQSATLTSWLENGRRGIVKHATGSGKTITGILALAKHLDRGGVGIILVPSRLLMHQWHGELKKFMPEAPVLLAGDGNDLWKGAELTAFTMPLDDQPRLILAINDTARSPRFLSGVESGSHLMVLADEVHRVGSSENLALLEMDAGARLGLSATPERAGDPAGTAALFGYFGEILAPEISLKDAIDLGRLVEYRYQVHTVGLSEEEIQEWQDLSSQVGRAMSASEDNGLLTDHARLLLIKRARVMKKAREKVPLAADILSREYVSGQRWLVYCEDRDQLAGLRVALRSQGITAMEYHSAMSPANREATLGWLKQQGGIVLSIRCLDEGVDIPTVSHALIVASSQNPREFIQRRGRVLRKAAEKPFATIHDILVVPPIPVGDDEGDSISRKIAASELGRAAEFARDAMNAAALTGVARILVDLGFTVDEVSALGIEQPEGGGE